jgi:hypothetical protein
VVTARPKSIVPRPFEAVARELEISKTQARTALEMTPEVDQLQAEAKKKYPDTFAGLWRDNDRGSVIVLAFTRTPTLKRAVLERDFSRPDRIEERTARHSLQELESVVERITRDYDQLVAEGATICALWR